MKLTEINHELGQLFPGTRTTLYAQEAAVIRMFSDDTYGLEIQREVAKSLEKKGLVEWMPPKFGTTLYGLTEKGRRIHSALSDKGSTKP